MKRNSLVLIIILILAVLVVGCTSTGNKPGNNVDGSITNELTNDDGETETKDNIIVAPKEDEYDIEIGKLAPDLSYTNNKGEKISLENLNGDIVSLEDYRGKIVLLNFWATWCKFCVMEMPDLQKIDSENDDVVVIGVNVMENKTTVERYIEKGNYEFQVLLDQEGDLAKTYLVSGFPTTYFIDKNGILLGGIPSMLEYDQLIDIIESIRESEE